MKHLKYFALGLLGFIVLFGVRDCVVIEKSNRELIAYSKEVTRMVQDQEAIKGHLEKGYDYKVLSESESNLIYSLTLTKDLAFHKDHKFKTVITVSRIF